MSRVLKNYKKRDSKVKIKAGRVLNPENKSQEKSQDEEKKIHTYLYYVYKEGKEEGNGLHLGIQERTPATFSYLQNIYYPISWPKYTLKATFFVHFPAASLQAVRTKPIFSSFETRRWHFATFKEARTKFRLFTDRIIYCQIEFA